MVRCYRYRIYPNKKQRIFFAKTFGCVRFIYNKILEDKIAYYKEKGEMLKVYPAHYKDEFPWLREVDSQALCSAERNLDRAFQNFFKRPEAGFPRFKSKKDHRHSYTTRSPEGIRIGDGRIKLPKVGGVKIVQHREFNGEIKSATIVQEPSGNYYVSLTVHCAEPQKLQPVRKKVTVKLDCENLRITVNDRPLKNPMYMEKSEKRIRILQKKLSRCQEGSRNWENRDGNSQGSTST